jgi:hypothetical protein
MLGRVDEDAAGSLSFSFARDLPLTQQAIAFAGEKHVGQRRAADGAPFLLHTLEVASLLERSSLPDPVIAAAVLHDVLEHSDAERAELEARFGADVCRLVVTVSDDPAIEDEERAKEDAQERVRQAGEDALIVFAADKISKVREIRMLIASGRPSDAAAAKLRRYRRALEMLDAEGANRRVVELLRFEVEALEQLPPEPQRLAVPGEACGGAPVEPDAHEGAGQLDGLVAGEPHVRDAAEVRAADAERHDLVAVGGDDHVLAADGVDDLHAVRVP